MARAAADLYTVLLQEAGHVFGVGNSADPTSAMYEQYQGPRDGLAGVDAADLQALYGARTPDQFDGRRGNDTPRTATLLQFLTASSQPPGADPTAGPRPFVAAGDLTTLGGRAWTFTPSGCRGGRGRSPPPCKHPASAC